MDLRAATPYPLPGDDRLPPSAAPWNWEPDRAALVGLDMQVHFLGRFPPGEPPTGQLLENIGVLRKRAVGLGMPVVFCAEAPVRHPERRGLLAEVWGAGISDPADAEIVGPLAPRTGELLVEHTRPNAFLGSRLERVLRGAGRDQIVLCGLFARLGVLLTAADAFMHGIQPFVVGDAVADLSAEDHLAALRWAAAHGAVVTSTARALPARTPEEGAVGTGGPPG